MKKIIKVSLFDIVVVIISLIFLSLDGVLLSILVNYGNSITTDTNLAKVIYFVVLLTLLTTTIYISMYVFEYLKFSVLKKTFLKIKNKYLSNAIFYNYNSDTVMSFLNNDLKLFETNYLSAIFEMMQAIATALVALIAMILINPIIAFVFLIFSLFPGIVIKLVRKNLDKNTQLWQTSAEKVTRHVNNTVSGSNVINLYNSFQYHFKLLENVVIDNEKNYFKMNVYIRFVNLLVYLISMISFIIPFAVGIWYSAFVSPISFVGIVSLFLLNDRVLGPIRVTIAAYTRIKQTDAVVKKIKEEFKLAEQTPETITYHQPTIKIENVTYKIGERTLLDNISCTIPYGKKVLIIGNSGSGKTTLLKMIANEITDYTGKINILDNNQILENNFQCYSYIEQSTHIFYDSVKNNVGFGKDVASHLLKEMNFHHDLNYECDDFLSGGEKQKIGIARAITQQRKVILADEITAAIDNTTANAIRESLYKVEQTVIEIAHHYEENFISYDNVYKLEDGKLIQLK